MSQLSADDRAEIAELLARYCHAIDQRRWDDFLDLFTEDCRLDFGAVMGVFEGHDGIRRFMTTMGGLDLFMRHYTTNLVIRGDAARAHADSYVLAITGPAGSRTHTTGRYEDELVRTRAGWRLHRRRALIEMPV